MTEGASFRLDSDFAPERGAAGVITLMLTNFGDRAVSGFQLALTSLFRLRDRTIGGGRVVEQISNYLVIAPPDGLVLEPGASWVVTADRLSHRISHHNYGPKSAYLILADGTLAGVAVTPMSRGGVPGTPRLGGLVAAALGRGDVPVVPLPQEVAVSGARPAGDAMALDGGPGEARAAFDAAAGLAGRLFPAEAPLFAKGGGIGIVARLAAGTAEAYAIAFSPERVTVSAGDRAGFFNAFVTLGQWLRAARRRPDGLAFPREGTVMDRPRFAWRGFHLDVARQVYQPAELLRVVDRMAWLKLNRFHLHLTDDEGWRLDVPGYPQIADVAAWRGHGLPVPPLLGSPPERHGLVYARSDLAGIVRRADSLGIMVVPEIDVPGHCYAPLQAIPALRDPAETGTYHSVQAFPNNALNPALPETWRFLAAVFGEVADVFPGPWIHVGGDEVADGAWLGSPQAVALMRAQGWSEVAQLQSHFLQRCQAIIRDLGREVGGWQEAALGGGIDTRNSYLVAWRDAASGLKLAEQGYAVVMAPAPACYFDMAQSADWWEPGAAWAGVVAPETTYAYEPGADWPAAGKARIIGMQACLWSENLHDRRLLDHMTFPRLSALAETGWTAAERKDLRRFSAVAPLVFET